MKAVFTNTARDAVFLCYHSVSDGGPPLSVPPATFERQLWFLRRLGYGSGDHRALRALAAGERPDRPQVFLTFDDGFRDTFTQALPLATAYGFSALVFLLPPLVDAGAPLTWPEMRRWQERHPGVVRSLTWRQVEAMAGDGMEFGSHTCSHPDLTRLDDDRLRQELVESRTRIRERLGACDTIAYPFGAWNRRVAVAAADAGYRFAFSLPYGFETVAWQRGASRMSIPRVLITPRDGERRFRSKLTPAGRRLWLSRAPAAVRLSHTWWRRPEPHAQRTDAA